MEKAATPSSLEGRLGRRFGDPLLLEEALTPPSTGQPRHNQRLEFLGDALFNAAAALLIHRAHPGWEEGGMSKLRGLLVCTDSLHRWALDLGLELRRGPRSPKGGSPRKALADAMEALLAAAYLDAAARGEDAFPVVLGLVEARFGGEIGRAVPGVWEEVDSKTTLQEWAAAQGWPPPTYAMLDRSGPDHLPRFRVEAQAGGRSARAEAGTIREAETLAARSLLAELR